MALEVAGNPDPATAYEAKFAIGFCVATALVHGHAGPEDFTAERVAEPALRALAAKVSVTASARFAVAFPALRGAEIVIHRADGQTLRHHQPTRVGSPEYPSTDADISSKFMQLARPVHGARTEAVLRDLWAMREAKLVRPPEFTA